MKRIAEEQAIRRCNREIIVAGTQNIIATTYNVVDEDTVHNLRHIRHFIINAVNLAAGVFHTCALLADGTVWCWGANDWGQSGIGPHSRHERHHIPSIEPYFRVLDEFARRNAGQ